MRPLDIYNSPTREVTRRFWPLTGFLDLMSIGNLNFKDENNTRIELKEHFFCSYEDDLDYISKISSLWFDGHPVMVLREAGEDGDGYRDIFVTDAARFGEARAYMLSLDTDNAPVFNAEEDIPKLDKLYGRSLTVADLGTFNQRC